MGNPLRPSWRFRLHQLFWLPWRLYCWRKGHVFHKWACQRCLKVDEFRLAMHHVNRFFESKKPPWERRR